MLSNALPLLLSIIQTFLAFTSLGTVSNLIGANVEVTTLQDIVQPTQLVDGCIG